MELAILRLLGKNINAAGQFQNARGQRKIVYIAPLRALVQEKLRDWQDRFSVLGLNCTELSGDVEPSPTDLEVADIICSTPERFGTCTKRTHFRILLIVSDIF